MSADDDATEPSPAAPLEHRVFALLSSGRADEARALLEQAIAAAPGVPAYHANLAVALQALGRLDDATAAHRRAIELARQELGAMCFNLGTALAAGGRYVEAAAAYEEALAARPGWAPALDNLGTVHQRLGRAADAERAYRAALAAEPALASASYNLGTLLQARGDFEEAAACYRAGLALQPTSGAARALGGTLIRLGRRDEALAAYQLDAELAPEAGTPQRRLAAALLAAGDLPAALAAAEEGCAARPELSGEHVQRGEVLLSLDRLDDAAAAYRDALAADPADPAALVMLAQVLGRLGRRDEALAGYRRLLEVVPDHPVGLHLSAALAGEPTPAAPRGYVVGLFDGYASRFDRHLVGDLGYHVPERLAELVSAGGRRFARALDLGCGTGLVGVALRAAVDELHGVNLSSRMLDRARERGLYDELARADVVEHLRAAAEPRFDLVTAADVLIYVGAVEPLFAAVAARLAAGGRFAFSIELLDDGGDVRLCQTGRYAHARAYVERVAAACGLTPIGAESAELRIEESVPVPGLICVVAAPPAP